MTFAPYEVPAQFNVASFFVDRPVSEGRGAQGRVLPRGRRAHLRRAAGAGQPHRQRALRARREARAAGARPAPGLARVPRILLGGDQDRRGADSREHPDAAPGLPLLPERQPRRGAGGLGAALRVGGAHPLRGEVPPARGRDRQGAGAAPGLRPDRRARVGATRGGGHVQGRCRVLALLVGLDRLPEGRGAPAARHGGVHGHLRAPGARHDGERPHGVGGQALLRLRHGQQHVLPDARRRARACSTRTGRRPRRCSRPSTGTGPRSSSASPRSTPPCSR